ncbi:MAG: hypothetical protein ACK5UE_00035 [Chitinophagales bacterium]|nr:hypothetical protein [Sphingobacteriales bacterium]
MIDSQYGFRVKYEYTDNLMTKETAFRFAGNIKWYERYLVYDTLDLYDYHDTQYGLGDEYVNFENRIVSTFFSLNQKYLSPKEVSFKKYNPSGGLLDDHIYQYTYNTNNRGLVLQKTINELKQGIYKDTISYTYTCKF